MSATIETTTDCFYCSREQPWLKNGVWIHAGGVACQQPPEQPAPETGEWELGPEVISSGVRCRTVQIKGIDRFAGGYVCVAAVSHAERIIRNHRLARLVPELVDTLRLVQQLLANQTSCNHSLCGSCNTGRQTVLEAVGFALANAAAKGVR